MLKKEIIIQKPPKLILKQGKKLPARWKWENYFNYKIWWNKNRLNYYCVFLFLGGILEMLNNRWINTFLLEGFCLVFYEIQMLKEKVEEDIQLFKDKFKFMGY